MKREVPLRRRAPAAEFVRETRGAEGRGAGHA